MHEGYVNDLPISVLIKYRVEPITDNDASGYFGIDIMLLVVTIVIVVAVAIGLVILFYIRRRPGAGD